MSDDERWAAEPLDGTDELLLSHIRELAEASDPVPAGLPERISFALTVAGLEAEVARIIAEPQEAGTIRAADHTTDYERPSAITFESPSLSIMVTVTPDGPRTWSVRGWLSVPSAEVELRGRTRSHTTTADAQGRFVVENIDGGTVHLVVRRTDDAAARPVITPGFEL